MTALPTLSALLQILVTTSAYASLFALVVLLLQPLLRRSIAARWRFILWMVVLLRFVPLPLPESRISLLNWLPRARQTIAPPATAALPSEAFQAPPPVSSIHQLPARFAPAMAAHPATPSPARAAPRAPFSWLTLLYFTGATICFLRLLLASISLRRILTAATPIADPALLAALHAAQRSLDLPQTLPLLQTNALGSPALVGLWHPCLLLPADLLHSLTPDEFHLIFLHEAAHLRRRDIALNYFFAFLTLLHWFNPILWFILPRIRADRELACDELVLRHTADPAAYGHTLLKIFQHVPRPVPQFALGIVDTKTFFTRRIRMIAAFKKRPTWLAVPSTAALLIITACTLTSAKTPPAAPAAQIPLPPGYTGANPIPNPPGYATDRLPPANAAQPPQDRVVHSANAALSAITIDQLAVDDQPLSSVLDYLHQHTGLNIVANWKAMETGGIDKNSPLSLHLAKVPLEKVLTILLAQISPDLRYSFEDNVLTISTAVDLRSHIKPRTEIYNVRDLLSKEDNAMLLPGTDTQPASTGMFGQAQPEVGALIDLIKASCDSETWTEHGGAGTIVPYKGLLTITATSEVHEKIHEVLKTLRAVDKDTGR